MNTNSAFGEQHYYGETTRNENSLFYQPLDASFVKVGDYMLGQTIGKGTFGKVKLGVHLPTQEKVAIKILEKSMILTESDASSIRSEIQILSTLRHPNISQLLEIMESDSCIFLILEFAPNGELFHYIASRGKLSEKEACIIFAQALSALEYMQTLNICHRDLKPENMLFDANYQLKIIDFGLGKISTEGPNQQLYTCCGSPCYASPETLSSQPYVGKYVDLWSLGIILHAMLCGYLPFDDDNSNGLFEKIKKCEFTMPPCISKEAAAVISGLLKKEPTQRITIQEIKQTEFYKFHITGKYENIQNLGLNEIQTAGTILDKTVIQQMNAAGYNTHQLVLDIASKFHNQNTATYYLLKNKLYQNNQIKLEDAAQKVLLQHNPEKSTKPTIKKQSQSQPPCIQPQSSTPVPLQEYLTNKQPKNGSTSVSKIPPQSPISPQQQLKYQYNSLKQVPTANPPKQLVSEPSQVLSFLKTPSVSVQNIKTKKKNISVMTFKDLNEQHLFKQTTAPSISSRIPRSNIKQSPFGFREDLLCFVSELKQNPSRIPPSLVVSPMKDTNQLIQSPQLNFLKTSTPVYSSHTPGQHHDRSSKSTLKAATLLQSPRFKTENQKYPNKEETSNYQAIFANFLKSSYHELKKKSSKMCSQTVSSVIPGHRQTKSQTISAQIEQNSLSKVCNSQIIKRKNVNQSQHFQCKIPTTKTITEMSKIPSIAPKQRQSQVFCHDAQKNINNNHQHNKHIDNKNNSISLQMPQSFSDSSSGGQTTASNLGNNSQEPISPKSYQCSNSVSFTNFERLSLPSPAVNLPNVINPIQMLRKHKSDYANGNPTKCLHSNNNKSNPKNLDTQKMMVQDGNFQTTRNNRTNHQNAGAITSTKTEFIPEQCESPTNLQDIKSKTTLTTQLTKELLSQQKGSFFKPKQASFVQSSIPEAHPSQNNPPSNISQQNLKQFLSTQKDPNKKVSQKIIKPSKDLLLFLKKLKDVGKLSTNTQENLNSSKQPQMQQQDRKQEIQKQSFESHTMENLLSPSKGVASISLNISPQMIALVNSSNSAKQAIIERPRSQEMKNKQNSINNLHQSQQNIHMKQAILIEQKLPKQKYLSCSSTGRTTETTLPNYISNSIHTTAVTTTTTNSTITIPNNHYQSNQFISEKENFNSKPTLNNNYTVVIKPEIIPQKNDIHRTNKFMKQEKTLMALLEQLKITSIKSTQASQRDKKIDISIADWSKLQRRQQYQQSCTYQSPKLVEAAQNCFK